MQFTKTKLASAVLFAISSPLLYANEEAAKLDIISVVAEHSGAKSKTNVVTLQDLEQSTKEDLRGVLKAEPAINFGGGTGGTSQWTTIRGMGQDQIDIKVDNAYSDAQIFHHQSRFMLDPTLIKRIDVRKGAGSASAGIGATSGSIEATTVDAQDLLREGQNLGFKLNAMMSSNKGYSQGASVYGKSGAFDALLSANWETAKEYKGGHGYANKEGSDIVKNSALGQRGLLAKLGFEVNENHRFVVSHRQERYHGERALREEFDFSQDWTTTDSLTSAQRAQGYTLGSAAGVGRNGRPTYYLLDSNGALVANDANNNPRYRITTQETTNLEWTGKNLGFISEVKANAYLMNNEREETDTNSKTKITTKGANLNFDSEIGSDHLLKYGLNYRHQEGKPNALQAFTTNRRGVLEATGVTNRQEKEDIGVYAEGIWGLGALTMTTGLRYDHFDFKANDGKKASDGEFNPSVALIWEVAQGLSLSTNLNYATRSPRFYEVALSGSSVRSVDDNLKAEKARNTEIGFNYDFDEALSVNGSYFWQKVKDAHAVLNNTIVNSALVRNQGYELGAAYKIGGAKFRVGVADSKPETYTFNGASLDTTVYAVSIGRTWTVGMSYKFDAPSLEIGWKGRFVEGETGTPSRGSNSSSTVVKQSGYGVNDFYASWDATKNIVVNFAVNNAFNKNYKSHSQRAGANSLAGAGRDFRLNVNYTF